MILMGDLKIKYVDISEINPYKNNPRKNDEAVDEVANSIKEFGFKNPIILDKNNVIIAGHTRLKAAISLGMKRVPTILADDLTEEQVRAFRLADNKTGELAEWDLTMLDTEMMSLSDEMDMSLFGFESSEEEIIEPEEMEVKPFTKVFVLITADIKNFDEVLKILSQLDGVEGVTYDQSAHTD